MKPVLSSLINNEDSTGPPTAWPNQAIVAFDRPYPGVQYIQKLRWRNVLDFLWGSIQYKDFVVFWANSEGPNGVTYGLLIWISGYGSVALLIPGYNIWKICDEASLRLCLGGFSENRFFGTYQILWMSDLGGLTFVPYGLLGPNGDTKLLIWPIPLIYVKTAMTQVLDFVLRPNCTFACWFLL